MLSNETVQNSSLLRPNSKSNRAPFVVPVKDSLSSSTWLNNSTSIRNVTSAKSYATDKSKKSITILRPESIKRANNDACMAAAIGDLEWLKQSLKVSSEMAFDKNGFATIHLASIHCRLNILQYLIDELNVDVNFSSANGWKPIHLVINSKTGKDAVECLKFLIEKGAEINVFNEDNVTPLHMAATEGQYDCLKLLLENKADPFLVDYRNQIPLDLAKVWGQKKCAKALAAAMWHTEKLLTFKQESLNKKLRTQDVLLEIERAHGILHDNKKESAKKFDGWLNSQSFIKPNSKQKPDEKEPQKQISAPPNTAQKLPKLTADSDRDDIDLRKSKIRIEENRDQLKSQRTIVSSRSDGDQLLYSSQELNYGDQKRRPTIQTDVEIIEDDGPEVRWNYSTKIGEKDYIKNLDDFYPRDPYTCLPADSDLLLLHHELNGLTLDQVKEFMKKNLQERVEYLKGKQQKVDKAKKNTKKVKHSASTTKSERPVYYKPKNVIDYEAKAKPLDDFHRIDNAAFTLTEDPKSFYYQETKNIVKKQYSEPVLHNKKIKNANNKNDNDFKKIIENNFNHDLYEFMKGKNGKINPKYEKVFIC